MTTTTTTFTVELDDDGEPIQSNTPAWLLRRQTGIGASEAPSILGISRFESPRDVHLRKHATMIDDEQTEIMEFGHLMEPVAREIFRRRHGDPDSTRHTYLGEIEPPPGLLRSADHPHLLASLDAVILEPDGMRAPGQIKNVSTYRRGAWADSEGGVPDDVRVQITQEAIVLGADHGWALPIFGGNSMPEPIRVDVDREFVDWYLDFSADWWERHGAGTVEPAPTLLDDLSDVWQGVPGLAVDLDADLLAELAQAKLEKAEIKRLTESVAERLLRVKAAAGDATELYDRTDHPERLAATWRPYRQPVQVFHRDELLADHPELADLLAAYTRRDGATPRPFLIK